MASKMHQRGIFFIVSLHIEWLLPCECRRQVLIVEVGHIFWKMAGKRGGLLLQFSPNLFIDNACPYDIFLPVKEGFLIFDACSGGQKHNISDGGCEKSTLHHREKTRSFPIVIQHPQSHYPFADAGVPKNQISTKERDKSDQVMQ